MLCVCIMSVSSAQKAEIHTAFLALRRNIQSLQLALRSGDLETARNVFAALHCNAVKSTIISATTALQAPASSGVSYFVRLFISLRDGDLVDARLAFDGLLDSLRAHPPAVRRHRARGQETEPVSVVNDAASAAASEKLEMSEKAHASFSLLTPLIAFDRCRFRAQN